MEAQYPGPVGGDEVMLAELMLPDQTHLRAQDWTIFFLHKDADAEDELQKQRRQKRRRRRRQARNGEPVEQDDEDQDDDNEDDDNDYDEDDEDDMSDFQPTDPEGPPLVHVLNLVNTKQDHTVKRGAVVKAMAICTRHSFLHIYKPLLLLALEQYFSSPMDYLFIHSTEQPRWALVLHCSEFDGCQVHHEIVGESPNSRQTKRKTPNMQWRPVSMRDMLGALHETKL